MSWNDNGNNGSRDPWGNKNDGPDIDEAIKKFKSLVGSFMGGKGGDSDSPGGSPSFKKILPTALVVIIVLYSALGIYTVDAQEEAVVLSLELIQLLKDLVYIGILHLSITDSL